jgi:hypothetical protein
MVHPVKTPLGAVGAVTRASFGAARHTLRTLGDAVAAGRALVASVAGRRHPDGASRPEAGTSGEPAAAHPAEPRKWHGDPLAEEAAPAEPEPVDEAPVEPAREQVATEPSAVTGRGDDEEIPSPAVQPDEEDVEVTTPVGTTGAGPGSNPDTTESDLQQPGTEPLMDPATTKRVKREAETLRRASERRKD